MKSKFEWAEIKSIPYLRMFLLLYLLFNLVGIINFPFYTDKLDPMPLLVILSIGFIGFLSGTLLMRYSKINIRTTKGLYKPVLIKAFFIIGIIFSFLLISIAHIKSGGVILFIESERFTASTFITLSVYIGIITTLLYFSHILLSNSKIKIYHIVLILIQAFVSLSMGYRSPLILLIGACFFIYFLIRNDFHYKYKNIFSLRNSLFFLVVIILMSAISTFRVAQQYNVKTYFRNINMNYIEENYYLKPYMSTLSVLRYDSEVLTILLEKTKNNHLYGELATANLLTLLPGMQLGARNKIGEIIDARKLPDGRPWSITPTLQGALYVDAGFLFVFFGFFILAALIEYLKKVMMVRRDPFSVVFYVLLAVNSLMLIHTGYFDVSVFILLFLLFIIRFLVMRIGYRI